METPCHSVDERQTTFDLDHSSIEFFEQASKQVAVVEALTTTNHETFECLKAFCEIYKSKLRKRKVHAYIVEQSGAYVSTIELSCGLAQKGMELSREAIDALSGADDPTETAEFMSKRTCEALKDAQEAVRRFRDLRVAIFNEMQSVHPGAELKRRNLDHDQIPLQAEELKGMKESDLLYLTSAVLDRFVTAIGNFVDWWGSLKVDIHRLTMAILYIRNHPQISRQVQTQWLGMEKQYRLYQSEITAQQDYYDSALADLVPKSIFQRLAYKLHLT